MNHQRRPLQFALLFLISASLWVLLSEYWLNTLGNPEQLIYYRFSKALLFVVFTSVLIFFSLRAYQRRQQRTYQALQDSEERFKLALDSAQEGLWDWNLSTNQVYYSPRYCQMLGYQQSEFGRSLDDWLELLHPDDRELVSQALEQQFSKRQRLYENTHRARHKDGSYRWIQARGQLLLGEDGQPLRFIGTSIDVSQQRAAEDSLRQAAAVFDSTQEGVLVSDHQLRIVHVNPSFSRITGYQAEDVIGQTPAMFKSGRHGADFYQSLWKALHNRGNWSGEVWNRRKSGEIYPLWQSIRCVYNSNGQLTNYVAVFSDVSAIKRSQNELDFLAHHDPLTGLPNRLLFSDRLQQALERGADGALLTLDIDHFKLVNESLGHSAGDELIKLISERLRQALPNYITLARLGGDEFVLMHDRGAQAKQATQMAKHIQDCLAQPFNLNQQTLFISASLGISLFPEDGHSVSQVLRNADSALSHAKSHGRNSFRFYSHAMTEHAQQRIRLEAELRLAIELNQLRAYYQPIHRLDDLSMIGVEALVRWEHPQRGMVSPAEFIPVAEDSGLISAIDFWMLGQACQQMQQWQRAHSPLQFVAVNASSRQFSRDEIVHQVELLLERFAIPAASLELEVTESAVMDNPAQALALLDKLHSLGIHLAIDDFGTGHSSLARLKRLPVHKLKLDQSFVRGLPDDAEDAAIARAVVSLGHSLGLRVLAEGIETQAQADYLREIGCDLGQGYWFGRPQPAEQLRWPVSVPEAVETTA